jgi:hypothetical protein
VDALRQQFRDTTESAVLVHSDELQDGVMAQTWEVGLMREMKTTSGRKR